MRKAIRTAQQLPQTGLLTRYICSTEKITEEQLLFGHGASHLLGLLLRALHPRNILLPTPAPHAYEQILEKEHVEIHPFPLDAEQGFGIAGEQFKERWKGRDAALILNPHNPTGATLSQSLITELIRTSTAEDKLLIIDETLREFTENPPLAQYVVATPNAIILRTFSTYHALAGLRLGYMIGDEDLLWHLKQMMEPWPINSIAPPAALASVKDKGYRKRTAQFLKMETDYALKKIQVINRVRPIATPWGLLIHIEPAVAEVRALLADEGILIDEYSDTHGNQYLSFPFRSHAENARFFRALKWVLKGR
jgi:threonine-phosphate decarboxylase